jgi:hypothetical protein
VISKGTDVSAASPFGSARNNQIISLFYKNSSRLAADVPALWQIYLGNLCIRIEQSTDVLDDFEAYIGHALRTQPF